MVICENWAVSRERAAAFFGSQRDVTAENEVFCYGSCRITLTATDSFLFGRPMPRTVLRIEGPEEEARAIYQRFYLQFLSAGG